MIKNAEDLKKIQIVCKEIDQVEDCYNYLEQLGFKTSYNGREGFFFIIRYNDELSGFSNYGTMAGNKYIEFYNKKLIKALQKLIKEKEKIKDIEVASDGRIIKINNCESNKAIFVNDWGLREDSVIDINVMSSLFSDYILKYGLAYKTKEARDKAMLKIEIETKLKNIAERLNNGRKINWKDGEQNKFSIYYNYNEKILEYECNYYSGTQGAIYCLDKNFLDVAKKEIGEENLIKYFKD